MERAKKELREVTYYPPPYNVPKDADSLILCTEWDEFKEMDLKRVKKPMQRPLILDGRNFFDKKRMIDLGFEYMGMGIYS